MRPLILALVLVLVVGTTGLVGWLARPAPPTLFYTSIDVDPTLPPGTLLTVEPFTLDVPASAEGFRIIYTTRRHDNRPAIASAVVMVPRQPASMRPVIGWAHGTTGIMPGCAPSVLAPFANVPAIEPLLAAGWAYVGTDYIGLGADDAHAYLVGPEAAHAVLDAHRAALSIEDLSLSPRTVIWGHSQGGHAALWTGQRAAAYAPDLDVLGVAAFAPASDLPALFSNTEGTLFGRLVSAYLLSSYAETYPDVAADSALAGITGAIVDDIAGRCVVGLPTLVPALQSIFLPTEGVLSTDPAHPFGRRLADNVPTGPFPMPVLIAQGVTDDLVLEPVQASYARARCADGAPLDYRPFPGLDHLALVADTSALIEPLMAWTAARFAGEPAATACPN